MQRTTFSPKCCYSIGQWLSLITCLFVDTYSNFEGKLLAVVVGRKGVQDRRQLGGVELDYKAVSI